MAATSAGGASLGQGREARVHVRIGSHQAARLDEAQGELALHPGEIGAVGLDQGFRLGRGRDRVHGRLPGAGNGPPGCPPVAGHGLGREARIVHGQERQVEQPFARIVDDLDDQAAGRCEHALHHAGRLEAQLEAERRQPLGGLGPAGRVLGELAAEGLEGEGGAAGGDEPGALVAVLVHGGDEGQVVAVEQVVDQGRGEDGLAAAPEAGDGEADMAVDEAVAEIDHLAADVLDEIAQAIEVEPVGDGRGGERRRGSRARAAVDAEGR